jgi:uncharacterized membrane protein YdjX (TVP38/TMEM64 family)/rhodanese-related sulfurtransferase
MKTRAIRLTLLLLLIAGISLALTYRDQFDVQAIESWVEDAGVLGPLVFMLIYIVGTVFFLPGSLLTLTGGVLFGPVLGTFYNLTGATIGAIISFIVARYLAQDWVENKTGGRLKQLKQGVEGEGWRFVAFVRLVPLFPFNILNYALGLTKIKLHHYSIATYIFMLPGAIAYTYLGYAGREALSGDEATIQKIMLAIALLAVVGFLPRLIGMLRGGKIINIMELKQKWDAKEDMLILDVRTAADYVGKLHHIEGSKNISLEELPDRINELEDDLQKNIILVCTTDRRSAKAAQLLSSKGFTHCLIAKGGMTDWNSNNFPTVS